MSGPRVDIGVASNPSTGIVELELGHRGPARWWTEDGWYNYPFALTLDEARTAWLMLGEAIEHIEAGGHADTGEGK